MSIKPFTAELILGSIKAFGALVRILPLSMSLGVGRFIGLLGYYCDGRHRALAYANIKTAFAHSKKPSEIKRIVKKVFQNYGQNLIELLRLPLITPANVERYVDIQGKEHIMNSLKGGKGVIFLAMHFGSWELVNPVCSSLGPYNVIVNPQDRFAKLDHLLNSYRRASGSVVLERGFGTRDLIKSLQNNQIVGMVVDQGGKGGALVKYFGRQASMSVGAIRLGLKWGVPICFSVIIREKSGRHRLVIHPPLDLIKTGDTEKDVVKNLETIVRLMEDYITRYPAEYMWFYKIWKYSKEATVLVVSDGKAGHLNQSKAMAQELNVALQERGIEVENKIVDIKFKSPLAAKMISFLSFLSHPRFCQGRLRYLKWFLTKETFLKIVSLKSDFVISCGSSVAGVNFILSKDHGAKSICILKPGILSFRRFDMVVLPQHDEITNQGRIKNIVMTQGAPNMVTREYLSTQVEELTQEFPQIAARRQLKIGVLIGGPAKHDVLSEPLIKMVIHQVREAAEKIDADIFLTTSRRTPHAIESLITREFKGCKRCQVLIIANEKNFPSAVGGILGASDIVVVSGDSISMVSEAATAGKNTIVFNVKKKKHLGGRKDRHVLFLEKLSSQGFIFLAQEREICETICEMAKNKLKTRMLNDRSVLLEAARRFI